MSERANLAEPTSANSSVAAGMLFIGLITGIIMGMLLAQSFPQRKVDPTDRGLGIYVVDIDHDLPSTLTSWEHRHSTPIVGLTIRKNKDGLGQAVIVTTGN